MGDNPFDHGRSPHGNRFAMGFGESRPADDPMVATLKWCRPADDLHQAGEVV